MFEPLPEFASDLDWMLQSGQANQGMLAAALLEEHYADVLRLLLAILDDPEMARSAARDAFSTALQNVYCYREQDGIHTWLYRLVLDVSSRWLRRRNKKFAWKTSPFIGSARTGLVEQTSKEGEVFWRRMDALDLPTRYGLLLHHLSGWSLTEVAPVLQVDAGHVRSQLESVSRELAVALGDASGLEPGAGLQSPDDRLALVFGSRWPLADVSQEMLDAESRLVLGLAERRSLRFSKLNAVKELVLTGLISLLVIGAIWGINLLLPEEETASLPARTANPIAQMQQFQTVSLTPTAVDFPMPTPVPQGVFYRVKPGDVLASIAAELGTTVEALQETNRIPHGDAVQPGQRLLIPGRIVTGPYPTPTAIITEPKGDLRPLTSNTNDQVISWRMWRAVTNWQTLWIDAQVISYGSQSYLGPPKVDRLQVWVSQDQYLALSGPLESGPLEVLLRNGDHVYRAQPGKSQPWFSDLGPVRAQRSLLGTNLNLLFSPNAFGERVHQGASMEKVGSDWMLGRQAIILSLSYPDDDHHIRLWVDSETGFVLRKQVWSADHRRLEQEVVISTLEHDVDFARQDLFDPRLPWRGGFALDASGRPIPKDDQLRTAAQYQNFSPLPVRLPPDGFDPSASSLTFEYPSDFRTSNGISKIVLFADGYILGAYEFGDPWNMLCARSPDGRRIAFVNQPTDFISQDYSLHWFELSSNAMSRLHTPLYGFHAGAFAFSPDSRYLAVFGHGGKNIEPGLYILDTNTDQLRFLTSLADARSIVWSPDGKYLALIGMALNPTYATESMIIRVDSGEVVQRALYNGGVYGITSGELALDWLPGDWPTREWPAGSMGVAFPVEMGGLEACSRPPEN